MEKIDVKRIIEKGGLDAHEVAKQLFPKAAFPKAALDRIVKGKGSLNEDQISKLSHITGIAIGDLFTKEGWKLAIEGKMVIIFEKGSFKAVLDRSTWITRLYDGDSMFHESVILSGAAPVSEFVGALDDIIENQNLL